jgi:hypothetical protein
MAIEDITGNELDTPRAKALRNQQVGYHFKPARKTAKIFQVKNKIAGRLNWFSVLEGITLIGAIAFIGYQTLKGPVSKGIEELKFRQACNQAVEQYGDSNRDGFVSAQENRELFQNIFYNRGITFNSKGAIYSDGRQVPTGKLTQIINDYIDNPVRE